MKFRDCTGSPRTASLNKMYPSSATDSTAGCKSLENPMINIEHKVESVLNASDSLSRKALLYFKRDDRKQVSYCLITFN